MNHPIAPVSRRRMLQAAAGAVLLPAAFGVEAQISLSLAINRTARFRALSQRAAKAHVQMFLEVLPDNARDTLSSAQSQIQSGFDDLAKGTFPPAVTTRIQAVHQEATALITQMAGGASKTSVPAVAAQADKMLGAAQKATEALEEMSKQNTAKLVNLAGRQRMLSQRLAKNYFLAAAGFEPKNLRDQNSSDVSEFKQALVALGSAPISTPSIRNELALAESQWVFFSSALQKKPEAEALRTIATTSERLLDVMNNLTNLYDSALRDLLGSA